MADIINVTYDVAGAPQDDNFIRPFIALDDLAVTPGNCPSFSM